MIMSPIGGKWLAPQITLEGEDQDGNNHFLYLETTLPMSPIRP